MEQLTERYFKVDGMTCQHCVAAITQAIRQLDGQAQVAAELASGRIRVDSSLPSAALLQAIAAEGYGASSWPDA